MKNSTHMRGELNLFQRTVLLWNEIHPYNAVHVIKIRRQMDVPRLEDAAGRVLRSCGLVRFSVDSRGRRYHYDNGTSDIPVTLAGGTDPLKDLEKEIERQLDMPFTVESGPFTPFRLFVIPDVEGFYLGIVYFHLIAGADSIIPLMKAIVTCYSEEGLDTMPERPDLYPDVYRKSTGQMIICLLRWMMAVPFHISEKRRSFRPKYRDRNDHSHGFRQFTIPAEDYHVIIAASNTWDVTVNDLFITLLLRNIAPLAAGRSLARRRKNISVSSIINIREDLSVGPGSFGIFLSYFNISHPVPDDITLERLAKDVHTMTEKIKRDRLYLLTLMEMAGALFVIPLFFRKRKRIFYSKYNPVWGGITNVNLNSVWNSGSERPEYYLRAVSTGQATPLVFSFTTVNDIINVGVSYRRTCYSDEALGEMIAGFSKCLCDISAEVRQQEGPVV